MADGFLVAVVGFASAIVGGALQAWATRRFEVSRFEREARHLAYRRYLEGISQLSFAPDDNNSHLLALAKIAEARGQIALCGSDHVIMCMNRVFQHGDDIRSPQAFEDIKSLLAAMRQDTLRLTIPNMETELYFMFYGNGPGVMEK